MTATVPIEEPKKPARPRAGFAVLVAAGILLSRIAGLVRESAFAYYLGNSAAAGAYKAGLKIPNFLQNLFGEGVLSASFIPVYARLLAEDDEEMAGRLAGVILALLGVVIGLIVAVCVVITPWIIDLIAPGFHGAVRALTIRIVQILFPATGLLVLSAWCLGVLNSHRKFFLSYVAPVFWNGAIIAAMVMFGKRTSQDGLAIALSWGTVAGSALQFGIQVPFVLKYAPRIRISLNTALQPVREVIRSFGPVVFGRGVVQLSGSSPVTSAPPPWPGWPTPRPSTSSPSASSACRWRRRSCRRCRARWEPPTRSTPPCASGSIAACARSPFSSSPASWPSSSSAGCWYRCSTRPARSSARTRSTSGTS